MPISATMSLFGLYRLKPSIFDSMVIPSNIDRETLIDNILIDSANFEILYSDPEFLEAAIGAWSAKRLPVWTKLLETENYDYDPIANYDRTETETEVVENDTSSKATSDSSNESVSASTAFNSDTFKDTGRATSDTDGTSTGKSHQNYDRVRSVRVFGNIGVTTSQQMIEAQRDVVRFNTVDFIVNDFLDKFCIGVFS